MKWVLKQQDKIYRGLIRNYTNMSIFHTLDVVGRSSKTQLYVFNPLTTGAAYIRVFIFY